MGVAPGAGAGIESGLAGETCGFEGSTTGLDGVGSDGVTGGGAGTVGPCFLRPFTMMPVVVTFTVSVAV